MATTQANDVALSEAALVREALATVQDTLETLRRADEYTYGFSFAEVLQAAINDIGTDTPSADVLPTGFDTGFARLNRLQSSALAAIDRVVAPSALASTAPPAPGDINAGSPADFDDEDD